MYYEFIYQGLEFIVGGYEFIYMSIWIHIHYEFIFQTWIHSQHSEFTPTKNWDAQAVHPYIYEFIVDTVSLQLSIGNWGNTQNT